VIDVLTIAKYPLILYQAFTRVAQRQGMIIISELFLPDDEKTIKPITTTVGGTAGGAK